MPILHDAAVRTSIEARVRALRPDAIPRWGKMSVDQMLWHVNQALAVAAGRLTPAANKVPVPRSLIKFAALNLPWTRNAPR